MQPELVQCVIGDFTVPVLTAEYPLHVPQVSRMFMRHILQETMVTSGGRRILPVVLRYTKEWTAFDGPLLIPSVLVDDETSDPRKLTGVGEEDAAEVREPAVPDRLVHLPPHARW